MTIWSVTLDTECGVNTFLYSSEHKAYELLAALWFPESSSGHERRTAKKDAEARRAMLDCLEQGTAHAAAWFEEYLEEEDRDNRVVVQRHDGVDGNLEARMPSRASGAHRC